MDNKQAMHIVHPFPALYNSDSRILILGSFPSVKSREVSFFYGHPQNRFWKVVSTLLGEECPNTIDSKRSMLLRNGIALWDVIAECDIIGSSDTSIRNAVPSDLSAILSAAPIEAVFCNGKTSGKLYGKYQEKTLGMQAVVLPSTSPANAACSFDELLQAWQIIIRKERN